MTLISFAQNFEDIMLWRALKHVSPGFYVDIGAAWPDQDSVTRLFYDHDWSGINVEPNPSLFSELVEQRTRDVNLPIAISDRTSTLEFFVVADTGLSTLDAEIAEMHRSQGREVIPVSVPVSTLALVWAAHVPQGRDVHFLKIDVEGLETSVIRGADLNAHRPWILVVEATVPTSQTESHSDWESIVLKASYLFAYADGINRFYVAAEHEHLLVAFRFPPNVFDGFISRAQADSERTTVAAEVRAIEAEGLLERARFDQDRLARTIEWQTDEIGVREGQIAACRASENVLRERVGFLEATLFERNKAAALQFERLTALVAELNDERHARDEANVQRAQLEHRIHELNADRARMLHELSISYDRSAELDRHISNLYRSRSWRVAAPFRALTTIRTQPVAFFRRVIRAPAQTILRHTVPFVLRRPKVEATARRVLVRLPGGHARLYQFATTRGIVSMPQVGIVDPMDPPTMHISETSRPSRPASVERVRAALSDQLSGSAGRGSR